MKKNTISFFPIGFSSVVLVLITIFFFTFAVLTLSAAHADYTLSNHYAKETTAYYEADVLAKEMCIHIEEQLDILYQSGISAEVFYQQIKTMNFNTNIFEKLQDIKIETVQNYVIISYIVPISENQHLSIALKVNYPQSENECFLTIIGWQTVSVTQ